MTRTEDLTTQQLDAISAVERVCSAFSLIGCIFIIVTFLSSKAFHKPINRLVFYASWGNMMSNVGTLMARNFVGLESSVGCQLQAFLIQMFMPADAFWTLAMAMNVYLTFYYKFDAHRLRKMEIPYVICCYGLPFIVAFVYIFINDPQKGRFYGNATLWCWVRPEWDAFRILTFYGPVWVVISITMFIYVRAGREIYKKHKELSNFNNSTTNNDHDHDNYGSMKTTEVFVTSEVAPGGPAFDLASVGRNRAESVPRAPNAAYSVTISSAPNRNQRESLSLSLPIQSNAAIPRPIMTPGGTITKSGTISGPKKRRAEAAANNAAWSYAKCSILFFTAILVTWIPSSANRVYSVIHDTQIDLVLEFMSSAVLPLQGFWNAIIYMVTSWSACKILFANIFQPRPPVNELVGRSPGGGFSATGGRSNYIGRSGGLPSAMRRKDGYESDSMTDFSGSRPGSNERKYPV